MSRVHRSQNDHLSGSDHKFLRVIADDHAHLMDLLNALKISVNSMPINYDKVGKGLETLLKDSAQHFSDEESIMLKIGYAGFADHRAHHRQMLGIIRIIIAHYQIGKTDVESDVVSQKRIPDGRKNRKP